MPKDYSGSGLLPIVWTYYGHPLIAVSAKVTYIDKTHPKVHYAYVELHARRFDPYTKLTYAIVFAKVRAWVGDNDMFHFMEPLPGETECKLDYSVLFSVTPEQEEAEAKQREVIINQIK